jgi:hypothetical protein
MSIESSAFGVTRLTHEDAAKFKSQITYGRPNKEATAALSSGKTLLKALNRNGVVSVKLKKP